MITAMMVSGIEHVSAGVSVGLAASFTTGEALAGGLAASSLYRMRDRGELVELSRGVWRRSDAPASPYESLRAVTLRAPHGMVCLVSALSVHELTDDIPRVVDVAVPRGTTRPAITYPPVVVHVFDPDTFELGRTSFEIAPGEPVAISDPVRTVIDVLRLRNRVGTDVAYQATRRLLERDRVAGRLLALSRRLRCEGPVAAALEVLG